MKKWICYGLDNMCYVFDNINFFCINSIFEKKKTCVSLNCLPGLLQINFCLISALWSIIVRICIGEDTSKDIKHVCSSDSSVCYFNKVRYKS